LLTKHFFWHRSREAPLTSTVKFLKNQNQHLHQLTSIIFVVVRAEANALLYLDSRHGVVLGAEVNTLLKPRLLT
jgi:hypothetical protein